MDGCFKYHSSSSSSFEIVVLVDGCFKYHSSSSSFSYYYYYYYFIIILQVLCFNLGLLLSCH